MNKKRLPVLALALAALAARPAPALGASGSGAQGDPSTRLQAWIGRARSMPRSLDEKRQAELRAILGELRVARDDDGAETAALDLGLVELASLECEGAEPVPALLASARLGRGALLEALAREGAPMAARLASDVLDAAKKRPRAERLLAAQLLLDAHVAAALPSLRAAAREGDPELARAALKALCGWADQGVHLLFLEELARKAPTTDIAAEHFRRARATLAEPVLELLEREVAWRYLAEDWREAARARGLARGLDLARAVPILIEAMATWDRRTDAGQGSKRIRAEILSELQRLSGRSIGAEPARWSEWWEGARAGRIALPADLAAAGIESTSAAFFGLHAVTDRVLFVVDRSGSMRTGFGTGGRSRHDEAIEQLACFLRRSGPDTRFSVALFNRSGEVWRGRLTPASEANLVLARGWLEQNEPDGETRLFEGLRAGLGLDARGRLDLERSEADTVIVLCDGATSEGPAWVARWLERENERAQLVFHCVQIGSQGNGTLEALAEGSRGKFVRVQE